MLYNFRVEQPLVLEPPRGHIIIGVNTFIHHRDDVSGVWRHRMMLHHGCGEAVKNVLWKLQEGIRWTGRVLSVGSWLGQVHTL